PFFLLGRLPRLLRFQLNVMHHAGVMHFALTLALCDFLAQIPQTNIGTVAFNKCLGSILARASAFLTGQPNNFAGIFAKLKGAVHVAVSSTLPTNLLADSLRSPSLASRSSNACAMSSVTSRDHPSAVLKATTRIGLE